MRKILFFIFISSSFFATAQTETTIRNHYTDVNKQIAESIEHGFEGPLYNNQWVANKNGRSWPAVGNYTETTDFWYDDPPDHNSAPERNSKNVLLKVNISRKASHLMTSEEYLYKDGKLLFYYAHEGEEGKEWETKIWFNTREIMFKSIVKEGGKKLTKKDLANPEYSDFKPKPLNVLRYGKKYQDLFVKSMAY